MKIIKLFIDENIKIWKKLSTKIMIVAIILSLFAVLALVKKKKKTEENTLISNIEVEYEKEDLEREIQYFESQLENEKLDEESRLNFERNLEVNKLYLEYNIRPYSNSWENELTTYIVEQKMNGQDVEELLDILKNKDFNKYIEYQKKQLKQQLDNATISEQEYSDNLTILDLKENKAQIITLGNRILRTETVALNMLSIIMYELENK